MPAPSTPQATGVAACGLSQDDADDVLAAIVPRRPDRLPWPQPRAASIARQRGWGGACPIAIVALFGPVLRGELSAE